MPPPEPRTAGRPFEAAREPTRPCVLLIEDAPDLARFVAVVLKRESIDCIVAGDGEEGLAMARAARPHLILLDVMLPGMSGEEVCRILKTEAALRKIPVVLLTALGEERSRRIAEEAGADGWMAKPIDLEPFRALLRKNLNPEGRSPGSPG